MGVAMHAPRRSLLPRFGVPTPSSVRRWVRGYSSGNKRLAFQLLVSYAVLFAVFSPAPVWNALSYADVSPAIIIILLTVYQPQNAGMWPLFSCYFVVGSLLGGGLSIAVMFATWAANGGSYESSVTKGATFVCLIGTAAAGVYMLQTKWEATFMLFLSAQVVLVFGGGVYSYWSPVIPWEAPFYYWALLAITLPVLGAASWLVFPIYAGRQVRGLLAAAFTGMASVLERVGRLMLGELNPQTGRLAAAAGKLSGSMDVDAGLLVEGRALQTSYMACRRSLATAARLAKLTQLEVDLYGRPRHFPILCYRRVKSLAWYCMGTLISIIRPLIMGGMQLGVLQRVGPEVQALVDAMAACCRGLAGVIVTDAPFGELVDRFNELDSCWYALTAGLVALDLADASEPELYAVSMLTGVLRQLAGRLRMAAVVLAQAVQATQPEAMSVHVARLKPRKPWLPASQLYDLSKMERAELTRGLLSQAAAEAAQADPIYSKGDDPEAAANQPVADWVDHATACADALPSRPLLVRAVRRVHAGLVPPHIIYGLQYGLAVAMATSLVVITPVWFALHESTRWVVVTVLVMHQPTIGAMTWKMMNRLCGVAIGCVAAYIQLGLAYAINGCSWDNTAGKMITLAVGISVWNSFCVLNRSRFPTYLETWSGATLSASLLVVPMYRSEGNADWALPGWRLVALLIGFTIMALVSGVLFPVSARSIARRRLAAALGDVAGVCSRLQAEFVPAAEGLSPCGTDGSGEPAPEHHFWERPGLLGLLRIAGANLYQQEEAAGPPLTAAQLEACPQLGAFFDPRHLLVLEQASEAAVHITAVYDLTVPLTVEWLPLAMPHRLSVKQLAFAVRKCQVLLTTLAHFWLAQKMERSPDQPWVVPANHYQYLRAAVDQMAECLQALGMAVTYELPAGRALRTLDAMEGIIRGQLREVRADLHAELEDGGDGPLPAVGASVATLVFVGAVCLKQLQYLYLAAARTFLADQPDVLRLAEARATRADPLGGMDAQEEVQACFLLMLQEPSRRRSLLLSASRRNLADMGAAAGGGGSLKELDAAAEGGGSGLGARAPAAENGSDAGGEPLPAVAPPGL